MRSIIFFLKTSVSTGNMVGGIKAKGEKTFTKLMKDEDLNKILGSSYSQAETLKHHMDTTDI